MFRAGNLLCANNARFCRATRSFAALTFDAILIVSLILDLDAFQGALVPVNDNPVKAAARGAGIQDLYRGIFNAARAFKTGRKLYERNLNSGVLFFAEGQIAVHSERFGIDAGKIAVGDAHFYDTPAPGTCQCRFSDFERYAVFMHGKPDVIDA
jgi:hypothetical protein